jgi:fructose-1,6-bisphosphatase I
MTPSRSTDDVLEAAFEAVAQVAPEIRAGLAGRRAKGDETNPSGEHQLAADTYADDLLLEAMEGVDGVGTFASEERTKVVEVGDDGGLSAAFDPLDGSSNLKPNNTMGTIVALYDAPLPAPGDDLVGAAYILFGPITTMITARDGQVSEYVIEDGATDTTNLDEDGSGDAESGERQVIREDVSLPDDPSVYGFGARISDWTEEFAAYAEQVEADPSMKLRYGGAMIGDVNQVLTYGGVFAYPALESAERGKLRLQFEGNPIGYILESAGGRSSDGEQSLLDVAATDLHQRVPVYVGNDDLIDLLEETLR